MWHIAVLWGLDGTLLDNDEVLFDRFRLIAAKHGTAVSREDFFEANHVFGMPNEEGELTEVSMRLHGASDKGLYYWLVNRKPAVAQKVAPEDWIADLQKAYERLEHRVRLRPQVEGFIRALDSMGIVQGLVTNSAPALCQKGLARLGAAADGLAFVEYGDGHLHPKPAPFAHQAAAISANRLLRERHGEACRPLVMSVEDSLNGVRAAHAAGLPAVQFLKPGQTPLALPAGSPEFRAVRDMRTLAEILVTLSGS